MGVYLPCSSHTIATNDRGLSACRNRAAQEIVVADSAKVIKTKGASLTIVGTGGVYETGEICEGSICRKLVGSQMRPTLDGKRWQFEW